MSLDVLNNHKLYTPRRKIKDIFRSILRPLNLSGHFNYAFIYGSWEVIRARKVGTTRTNFDYVIYRLFYPVILLGACLFSVVEEEDLEKFFSLLEVWTMIIHISYSFVFLQNCLQKNVYRDNVKHRQKIPERLVVTDEIEKRGHKFYICKRFSILPIEKLSNTEKIIYLLWNIIVTMNACFLLYFMFHVANINHKHSERQEKLRTVTYGILGMGDIFLTPIPMRMAHVVYPLLYYSLYLIYTKYIYEAQAVVIYKHLNWAADSDEIAINLAGRLLSVFLVHGILVGFCALRDYIISSLDDSRTGEQIQNLRSQKRLARRKIMNYVEGPEGRIIGITLEKHSYIPQMDEYIQTEKLRDDQEMKQSSSSSSGEEDQGYKEAVNDADMIPVNQKTKPQPKPRYKADNIRAFRFSSSSSDEDKRVSRVVEEIKDIRFPSPPSEKSKSLKPWKSRIPVPVKKLGLQKKPRDSKENIHTKLTRPESPPTPPFIKLVQTMIKLHRETRKEVEEEKQQQQQQQVAKKARMMRRAEVRVIRPRDEGKTDEEIAKAYDPAANKWGKRVSDGQQIGSKVADMRNEDKPSHFHNELTQRLEKVKEKRKSGDPGHGILKGERRDSLIQRREEKIQKRKEERLTQGKRGKPAYDPLALPDIEQKTTFHYLGTKLKGENAARNALAEGELPLFKKHPGIPPKDQMMEEEAGAVRSVVSFHPVVKYFDVNEAKKGMGNH